MTDFGVIEKKEMALRLCQEIGLSTMFTDFNGGMTLPLDIARKIAIVMIKELHPNIEYWEDVIAEVKKL